MVTMMLTAKTNQRLFGKKRNGHGAASPKYHVRSQWKDRNQIHGVQDAERVHTVWEIGIAQELSTVKNARAPIKACLDQMIGANAQNAIKPEFLTGKFVIDARGMAGFATKHKPLYPFTTRK